jgi:hypothetical protein
MMRKPQPIAIFCSGIGACLLIIGLSSCAAKQPCDAQFCNRGFSALVFSETGLIEVRVDGHARFFKVDPSTDAKIVSAFTYVPTSSGSDYTGYRGKLDGDIIKSATANEQLLRITRLEGVHVLAQPDSRKLVSSFEGR